MSGGTSESLASPGSWSPYQSHRAELPNVWSRRVHKRGPRAEMAEIRALSRGAGQRVVRWEGRGQQLGLGGQAAAGEASSACRGARHLAMFPLREGRSRRELASR